MGRDDRLANKPLLQGSGHEEGEPDGSPLHVRELTIRQSLEAKSNVDANGELVITKESVSEDG